MSLAVLKFYSLINLLRSRPPHSFLDAEKAARRFCESQSLISEFVLPFAQLFVSAEQIEIFYPSLSC